MKKFFTALVFITLLLVPQLTLAKNIKLFFPDVDTVATGNMASVDRFIPKTKSVAKKTLELLLRGPTGHEGRTMTNFTSIPSQTKLLSVKITRGEAQVNFNNHFEDGIDQTSSGTFDRYIRNQEVIQTLLQFPTIKSVKIFVEGKAIEVVTRQDIEKRYGPFQF